MKINIKEIFYSIIFSFVISYLFLFSVVKFLLNNDDKKEDKVVVEKKTISLLEKEKEFFDKDLIEKNKNKSIKSSQDNFKSQEFYSFLKYKKNNFLPHWYIPKNLLPISEELVVVKKELLLIESAKIDLEKMLRKAKEEGLDLKVVSAYRSYSLQKKIKSEKIKKYGKERADLYSADPGQSEHQLGTTVDISTSSLNYSLQKKFEKTDEFLWLSKNAEKYGFKLSYPKENPFYAYEPWHYRWFGKEKLKK